MRKISLSFISLLTVINLYGQAEQKSEQKFHFGLKAAPALAWFKSDTKGLESDGSRIGFIYGLITEFNFGHNYAFSTGIDVAYRGGKFKQSIVTPGLTTVTSIDAKLQYIEIPLTLKLKTNEIGMVTYYLQAGIAPGFNIRAREDIDFSFQSTGTTKDSSATDIDIKDDINALNVSMVLGGGLEYSLSGNTALMAGITFSNGLLDVLDSDAEARSNYLSLTIGILF